MYLRRLTFTKTTAMRFELKTLFLIIVLMLFTRVIHGQYSDVSQGQNEPTPRNENKITSQSASTQTAENEEPVQLRGPVTNDLEEGMDAEEGIFYSNAKMYVAGHNESGKEDEASMFIQGTAEFGNSAVIDQRGITSLTGHFVSSKNKAGEAELGGIVKLFNNPISEMGIIRFLGQWNKQEIKRVDYKSINGVITPVTSDEKLDEAAYLINFPRLQVRKENINKLSDIPTAPSSTGDLYDPKEMGYVSVATNVAIQVQELDITNGNRFSVDVKAAAKDGADNSATSWYKLNSGYADIVALTPETDASRNPGHSEVYLDLYKYTEGIGGGNLDTGELDQDIEVDTTNAYNVGGASTRYATFMRGMASPFDDLRADYMFYHVLTAPDYGTVTGADNSPIGPPDTHFQLGKGYFYAMDVSSDHFKEIKEKWHNTINEAWKNRARGGYRFSRLLQEYKGNGMSRFSIDQTQANKIAQRFNVGNVTIKLYAHSAENKGRVNVLGNPYMTPIYIGDILAEKTNDAPPTTGSAPIYAPDGWWYKIGDNANENEAFVTGFVGNPDGNTAGKVKVKAIHNLNTAGQPFLNAISGGDNNGVPYALIRPRYWVVNTAFVLRSSKHGFPRYAYNVKYDVVDFFAAATVDQHEKRVLEPMQMFLLQVATPGEFVFNPKMKVLPEKPVRFNVELKPDLNEGLPDPRTRSIEEESGNPIPDWLIIETAVDGQKITTDRTALRFHNGATLGYDEPYDIVKQLTSSTPETDSKTKSEELEQDIFEPMNVVYTKSSDGRMLLANGIGYKTKEVPLYYIPANNKQERVTMTIHGVETLENVEGAWLIERDEYGKEVYKQDLLLDNVYSFDSKPIENPLEAENRFILRFYDDGETGEPTLDEKPITCYYSGSTLYVGGLNEGDMGSKVQIFDLQGRLMGNTVVNNYPSMEYQKALGQGTFIVRITGKRNHTTKFVNIQNY